MQLSAINLIIYARLEIQCTLTPQCSIYKFTTIETYEQHYAESHENVCSICKRILPTFRLLDLHLSEVHDSFFAVLAERQHMVKIYIVIILNSYASMNAL